MLRTTAALSAAALAIAVAPVFAQEKVTFQDHVMPLIEANCAKCHNADKKKGDLDLTSYSATMAGGASGKVVIPGDADSSKLWKTITHAEEPTMPPNRGKMADKELAIFKKWIAGGVLENLGSKAVAGKPSVDLSLNAAAIGKPSGPPPMPGDLLLEPVVTVKRPTAVTGLAASPWAPVFAVAGQKQIVLYHADSLNLLGILPFSDGTELFQPEDLKFSRNGKLVVVSGGHAGKSGRVSVFDITNGERIITIGAGQEFDSVLSGDISPDQSKIATGGPSKMVRVYSTKDGSVLYKIKKHTDWVTAAAFSPNGEWLATGDRNGGIVIWDADNGIEIHNLAGHKSAVTMLNWRGDSKLLASSSEDGAVKSWEMQDGRQVKTASPHPAGAACVSYAHDGRIVTCGRDNQVTSWSADGTKLKSFEFTNELPVRAVFSHDDARVIATDWSGKVTVWNAATGKRIEELAANPPAIAAQLAAAQKRLQELQSGAAKSDPVSDGNAVALAQAAKEVASASNELARAMASLAPKEAEVTRLRAEAAKKPSTAITNKINAARDLRTPLRLAVTNATANLEAKTKALSELKQKGAGNPVAANPADEIAALKTRISRLQVGQSFATVWRLRESIAARKREQEKLLASGEKSGKSAAEKLGKEIAREEKELQKLDSDYQKLKSAAPAAQQQTRL